MTGEERYIGVFFEEVETRTDYTFKYNTHIGRHGWLRLTPAYSVKLVRELIKKDCKDKSSSAAFNHVSMSFKNQSVQYPC